MEEVNQNEELNKLRKDYKPNRATRRRRPPADPWYTKATHKIKKIRSKNAKTRQQRERAIARARKASKESYTQVS